MANNKVRKEELNMTVNIRKPFEGLKVVDYSSYIAGPVCAKLLADWGADVIKVESLDGDVWRNYGPNFQCPSDDDENPLFDVFNTNKRAIATNLRTPEGKEILFKLLEQADVFVTSVRTNALSKIGIEYEQIKDRFPRLIYATITGYGDTGPDKDMPGYDTVAFWAHSGFLADFAEPSGFPVNAPAGIGDNITGTTLFGGICAALYAREITGRGDKVTNSLYGAGLWIAAMPLIVNHERYGNFYPTSRYDGNPCICSYKCSDGEWVMISLILEKQYRACVEVMGISEILNDPKFSNLESMVKSKGEGIRIFEQAFAKKTSSEVVELLGSLDIVATKMAHYREKEHDEQALVNDYLRRFKFDNGAEISMPVNSVKSTNIGHYPLNRGPLLGEHTEEILSQIGYDQDRIKELLAKEVVYQK